MWITYPAYEAQSPPATRELYQYLKYIKPNKLKQELRNKRKKTNQRIYAKIKWIPIFTLLCLISGIVSHITTGLNNFTGYAYLGSGVTLVIFLGLAGYGVDLTTASLRRAVKDREKIMLRAEKLAKKCDTYQAFCKEYQEAYIGLGDRILFGILMLLGCVLLGYIVYSYVQWMY